MPSKSPKTINSDRDLTSLPLVPVFTSRDDPQRVPPASKDRQLSLLSRGSDRPNWRSIDIPNLLNPVKCERDRFSTNSSSGSLSLPRMNSDLQVQKCERSRGVDPKPMQPSQRDSPSIQYSESSSSDQFRHFPSSSSVGPTIIPQMPPKGFIQIPSDIQAASKRKQNAIASHNYRRRRKRREEDIDKKLVMLKTQVFEMEMDRNHL